MLREIIRAEFAQIDDLNKTDLIASTLHAALCKAVKKGVIDLYPYTGDPRKDEDVHVWQDCHNPNMVHINLCYFAKGQRWFEAGTLEGTSLDFLKTTPKSMTDVKAATPLRQKVQYLIKRQIDGQLYDPEHLQEIDSYGRDFLVAALKAHFARALNYLMDVGIILHYQDALGLPLLAHPAAIDAWRQNNQAHTFCVSIEYSALSEDAYETYCEIATVSACKGKWEINFNLSHSGSEYEVLADVA